MDPEEFQDRIYLTFEELAPTHWGFNGSTFD